MSDHLPECLHPNGLINICICPELRAAEQRVRAIYEVPAGVWEEQSFDAGLDKAREAVAALPANPAGYAYGIPRMDKAAALAAIDALRGES